MNKMIPILLLSVGFVFACNMSKLPEKESPNKEEKQTDAANTAQNFKILFLAEALKIKEEAKRVEFLKSGGFEYGIYHSAEPLSDGTTHETVDTGFQNTDITSKEYEFIHFTEFKNYRTKEVSDWLVYKTRNLWIYSAIRSEIKALKMEKGERGSYLYKDISISFPTDRYAYVDGKSYSIYSLILRQKAVKKEKISKK